MTYLSAIQRQIDEQRSLYLKNGWQFKERNPECSTIGDLICAVLAIETEEEAQEFYRGYIDYLETATDGTQPAKYVADMNIGWCFGEGMSAEKQAIWRKCTTASHPIFGRIPPTPQ